MPQGSIEVTIFPNTLKNKYDTYFPEIRKNKSDTYFPDEADALMNKLLAMRS